jgi:hypothetical protein
VLSSVLTLLALLILQAPFASVALYFVFIVGRDSPAVSLRSLFSMVPLAAAVATELGIVILTDNDPMARVLGLTAVGFFAGQPPSHGFALDHRRSIDTDLVFDSRGVRFRCTPSRRFAERTNARFDGRRSF